jgi:sterol desaturase/sphingolipid hydroxylase (fatty acid hydroxylase superfamily)
METVREQILILISTPIYLVIIGLEILLSNLQHQKAYTVKDTVSNVYLMLLNSLIDLMFRGAYVVILDYFFHHRFFQFTSPWIYWTLLVLAEDFLYYWLHRVDHYCRLFWAVHVTHHSSDHFNFTVGFRSSVFQPLYRFVYFIPLALAGFKPLDIVFIYSATQIWGIFVHTELIDKMGWFEYFMVTPSHHRVHHASNTKYLDRNMGMFLIIWDKLFGTFEPETKDEPIQYGLTTKVESNNPLSMIFHEWKNIARDLRRPVSWKDKFLYLFGPPGWSHDGSRLTSNQLREREKELLEKTSGKVIVESMQEEAIAV